MRDWAILLLFVAALPMAIRHTWVGVLLWNWISLMVPHKLGWGFIFNAPLAAVAAGVTLVSMLFSRGTLKMPTDKPVITQFLLVLWMCVTTGLAFFPAESSEQLIKVLKIQLMTFVAFAAIRNRKHIELFIWVNVLSVGFYGFKGGLFTVTSGGGGRVWGPPGGFIEDNNALAVALVMAIPLMHYLRAVATKASIRHGLLLLMALCAVSAVGSQSRGALLAIVAMSLFLWIRLRKKLLAGIAIVGLALSLVAFMPDSWMERMNTIQTYEKDQSASERLIAWQMTFNLANDRPWGGGFEIYNWATYERYYPEARLPQAAHSIYFSILGEHGWVGAGLFLLLFVQSYRMASQMRKRSREIPEAAWVHLLAGMCQASIIGYAVGGAFLSLAYYDFAYNLIVILVATNGWLAERGWLVEPTGPFGSSAPGAYVTSRPIAVRTAP